MTPLTGDTLGEIARQYLLAQAVIERESRLIDPSVLQALLKTDPVDLAETASAEAALAPCAPCCRPTALTCR